MIENRTPLTPAKSTGLKYKWHEGNRRCTFRCQHVWLDVKNTTQVPSHLPCIKAEDHSLVFDFMSMIPVKVCTAHHTRVRSHWMFNIRHLTRVLDSERTACVPGYSDTRLSLFICLNRRLWLYLILWSTWRSFVEFCYSSPTFTSASDCFNIIFMKTLGLLLIISLSLVVFMKVLRESVNRLLKCWGDSCLWSFVVFDGWCYSVCHSCTKTDLHTAHTQLYDVFYFITVF